MIPFWEKTCLRGLGIQSRRVLFWVWLLVVGTRENSSGNVANTLIQFNSRKKKRKESKSSQLSLFPWAKICLCLYHHSSHFACDYDLESFIFPPLSLSSSFFFSYQYCQYLSSFLIIHREN